MDRAEVERVIDAARLEMAIEAMKRQFGAGEEWHDLVEAMARVECWCLGCEDGNKRRKYDAAIRALE